MWGLMERLRAECPVSRPMEGFVYTASYADTAATFKDARRFSSGEGFRGAGVVVPDEESFLGEIDPPLHPRVRRLLHRAFTPRTAAEVEPFTREPDQPAPRPDRPHGGGDLMAGLCTVLPVAVSAEALGIPRDQHAEVAHWCQELLHSTWPETNATERGVGIGGGFPELAAHHRRADPAAARRHRPARRPAHAHGAGRGRRRPPHRPPHPHAGGQHARRQPVDHLHARQPALPLRVGPEFAATLRADRTLIPEAVEESLRLEPPVLFLFRTAKEDTDDRRHARARGRAGHRRHRVGQPRRAGVRVPERVPPRPRA